MDASHVLTGWGVDSSASPPVPCLSNPDPIFAAALRGTWFDETVDFRNPVGNDFASEVLALIAAVETRKRKRRGMDEIFHRLIVRRIVANALRCHYFRDPSLVAFFRKTGAYKVSANFPAPFDGDRVGA